MLAALLLLAAAPSEAAAPGSRRECLDVNDWQSQLTLSGKLTLQLFAGPPNYESIAAGDAEERTFILELAQRICIRDGGQFADPDESFDRVHVSASEELIPVLAAAVGRDVQIRGEAFPAHTGHHHAPLVLLATRITVR